MHTPWHPMDWRKENYTKWRELFQYILFCLDIVWHDVLSQSVSFIVNIVPPSLKHCSNIHFIERTRIAQPEPQVQSKPGSFIMGFILKKNVKFSVYGQFWGKRMAGARCCELITLGSLESLLSSLLNTLLNSLFLSSLLNSLIF